MKIRIALTPPSSILNEFELSEYFVMLEELGFDTVWLSDVPIGPSGDPIVSLAFAAAATKKLKLGMNLVPLGRNPLHVAKQLAQLDVLSRGRLLISFVPGLGSPEERAALGYGTGDRGLALERVMNMMRAWWSGAAVDGSFEGFDYRNIKLETLPAQNPLEIWLGGAGPAALDRVARLADGWLTASMTPSEAGAARVGIARRASELGRVIDDDHYGISIPYARMAPADATVVALRARRTDRNIDDILTVGGAQLVGLLRAHIDQGITKFVLRGTDVAASDWRDPLSWLAETVLPLQN